MFVRFARLSRLSAVVLFCIGLPAGSLAQAKPPPAGVSGKPTPPAAGKGAKKAVPPAMPPEVMKAAKAFEHAAQLQRARKNSQAVVAYQEFLRLAAAAKLPPTSTLPAYQNMALLYQATGDRRKLETTLKRIVQIDSSNVGALVQLATLAADLQDFPTAKAAAERALARKPKPALAAPAHFALGMVAIRKDQATAEKEFGLAARLAPENPRAWFNYALVLDRRHEPGPALNAIEKTLALTPKLTEARLMRAELKQQLHQFPAAVADYNVVLRAEPKNLIALTNRALLLQALGQTQDALSAYLDVLRVQPNSVIAHANAAELYQRIGNQTAAKEHFLAAYKLAPKNARILSGLAFSEFQDAYGLLDPTQRDAGIKQAETHYRQALDLNPKETSAQEGLASLYERTGRFDDAIALFRKLQTVHPDDVYPYYRIAGLYAMQHKTDDILATWKAYRARKPKDPVSYQESAAALDKAGRWESGLAEWKALTALDPDDGNAHLGAAHDLIQLKRPEEARAAYKAVLALDMTGKGIAEPGRKSAAVAAAKTWHLAALHGMAELAQAENKTEEAVAWLNQVKQMEAAQAVGSGKAVDPSVYREIASAYERSKQPAQAEQEYQAWAKALPSDPAPYAELARLYDAQNKPDEAVAAYRQAAQRAKSPVEYRRQIAELYQRRQEPVQALAEYEALQKEYPNDTGFYATMAQTYEQAGKDEKALALYDALQKSDPNAHWIADKRANVLIRLKRYPAAQALYQDEIARNPDNYQAYADLAHLYALQGKADAYLPWLKARFEETPANRTRMAAVLDAYAQGKDEPAGWAYIRSVVDKQKPPRAAEEALAGLLIQRDRRADALEVYRRIAAENPKDLAAQTQLADQLYAAGKPDEAIHFVETLLARPDLSADDKLSLRHELVGWYQQQKKLPEAIAQAQEIIKARPNEYTMTIFLAQMLAEAGRSTEAVPLLIGLSQHADYPPALRSRIISRVGGIYEQQGRKTDAVGEYREALKLDASNNEATTALKRLGAM